MEPLPERCTVCVVLRDRFSTTFRCLDDLIAFTPEPYDLVVILGGTPLTVRSELEKRYASKARFLFVEPFLNQAEFRNIALRETKTDLVAILDNDVYVRAGWLPSMVRCLRETGAALVTPVVLEKPTVIHTAGNSLMITHKDGKPYGQKELRYAKLIYYESSDLKRAPVDYGELHCQLLRADVARRLGIFDEKLHEQTEVDSGLLMTRGGQAMWFEPTSVVHFDFPGRITRAEDIRPFLFKWDSGRIVKSMEYFQKKWGVDITEGGTFEGFTHYINQKLGLWSRLFPSHASVLADESYHRLKNLLGGPIQAWRMLKNRISGSQRWKKP